MASRAEALANVLDILADLPLTHRKMMGEYVLYLHGKVVAVVADDRLWLKTTPGGVRHLPDCPQAAPFPGAKDWIDADSALDEPDRLAAALQAVSADLPAPKPGRTKRTKT